MLKKCYCWEENLFFKRLRAFLLEKSKKILLGLKLDFRNNGFSCCFLLGYSQKYFFIELLLGLDLGFERQDKRKMFFRSKKCNF